MRNHGSLNLIFTVLISLILNPFIPAISQAQQEAGQEQGAEGPPPGPPPVDPRVIRALKLRFEREPAVKDVQQAALKYFKVNREKLSSYESGAVWKSLMPSVEFIFNNEYGTNALTRIDKTLEAAFPWKDREDSTRGSLSFGVRANWMLDRLVFNAESLDVASLVGVQEGILREITSLYFTRRRLITSATLNPPQDPNEQLTEKIRLDEMTANIDALCGGYFSKEIERQLGSE